MALTITDFTPTTGAKGSSVKIIGTEFTGATVVTIGGTAVTSFTVVSATIITAIVASGTTGTILVTTAAGSTTSSNTFTIITIGAALSKSTTYKEVEDIVRLRTNTISDTTITSSLVIKLISLAVQKWAKVLNGATAPFYSTTLEGANNITGSANPYSVDLSHVSPFLDNIKKVVHITSGGTRTLVKQLKFEDLESVQGLTSFYGSSLFYSWEGDALKIFKGGSFTITIASDDIAVTYYRLPMVASVVTGSYLDIPDPYVSTIITEVTNQVLSFKNNGVTVASLDQELANEREAIKSAFGMSLQMEQQAGK